MLKQFDQQPAGGRGVPVSQRRDAHAEAGVTTVRDLGADQYMDIAMRDLINRGEMIGRACSLLAMG